MQFCQVLFLKKSMCVNLVLDKIEIWVYNVHRNPQGGLYTYPRPIFRFPPRVFLGILSEYLAQKYSPELVNKDFGDFLVILYISIRIPRLSLAYPLSKSRVFFTNQSRQPKNLVKGFPKVSLSFFGSHLWEILGQFIFAT